MFVGTSSSDCIGSLVPSGPVDGVETATSEMFGLVASLGSIIFSGSLDFVFTVGARSTALDDLSGSGNLVRALASTTPAVSVVSGSLCGLFVSVNSDGAGAFTVIF